MDFSKRLALSYYKKIAVLNEAHHVELVQHQENQKIFVKKQLYQYDGALYRRLQETRIAGIPKIVELVEEDNILTLIEDYIPGETLQEKIQEQSLSEHLILRYMLDLCTLLGRLHQLNPPIIHRDIKPANIIITTDNRVVLLDFNAAKFFTDTKSEDTVLLGTKGYAAPEQYGFGVSTTQTDIYAIGVLLQELAASLQHPAHHFDQIIEKCTQLNPADRFLTVTDLRSQLAATQSALTAAPDFSSKKQLPESPPQDTANAPKQKTTYALPGFRTKKRSRMVLATLGYGLWFYFCLSLNFEHVTVVENWLERFFVFMIGIGIIFVSTDYLAIRHVMPLCQHPNRFVRYIGIVLLDAGIFLFAIIALTVLTAII